LGETASIIDYVGRTRREEDEVTLGAVRRMAATLDQDPDAYRRQPSGKLVSFCLGQPRSNARLRAWSVMTGDFLPCTIGGACSGRRVRSINRYSRRSGRRVSKIARAQEKRAAAGRYADNAG
jgi:hypothetical protein